MNLTQYMLFFGVVMAGNTNGNDNLCEKLAEKISHIPTDKLQKTSKALKAYAVMRQLEEDFRKNEKVGWIDSYSRTAEYGYVITRFTKKLAETLIIPIDDIYKLGLPHFGMMCDSNYDSEEMTRRLIKAQECALCLEYLASKRIVDAYEKSRAKII